MALLITNKITLQSINDATVSQNTKDILPMILRMYDRRKLIRSNSLCPSLPDCYLVCELSIMCWLVIIIHH